MGFVWQNVVSLETTILSSNQITNTWFWLQHWTTGNQWDFDHSFFFLKIDRIEGAKPHSPLNEHYLSLMLYSNNVYYVYLFTRLYDVICVMYCTLKHYYKICVGNIRELCIISRWVNVLYTQLWWKTRSNQSQNMLVVFFAIFSQASATFVNIRINIS